MKAVTLKKLKDELAHQSNSELIELCLQLSKYKKENKELLTYLLFESHNETQYIDSIKDEMDKMFLEINTKSFFYIRKSVRKILRITKKFIKYSKKKETEVELLLHFCNQLNNFRPSIHGSLSLKNLFDRQVLMIRKAILTLHEDLQFDYNLEVEKLTENI